MKFFTGCVAAASWFWLARPRRRRFRRRTCAGRHIAVSDFDGPYAAAVTPRRRRRRVTATALRLRDTRPAPALLPPTEVYAVLRENGFSPLGIPRLRGFVYTIAVIDRGGEDGRLVIDARDGRIIRFMPAADAYRHGAQL